MWEIDYFPEVLHSGLLLSCNHEYDGGTEFNHKQSLFYKYAHCDKRWKKSHISSAYAQFKQIY